MCVCVCVRESSTPRQIPVVSYFLCYKSITTSFSPLFLSPSLALSPSCLSRTLSFLLQSIFPPVSFFSLLHFSLLSPFSLPVPHLSFSPSLSFLPLSQFILPRTPSLSLSLSPLQCLCGVDGGERCFKNIAFFLSVHSLKGKISYRTTEG